MAQTIPVSLILTTLNEERSILSFLKSVQCGTVLPAEIVICDGGSKDSTVDLIKGFSIDGVQIQTLVSPGATIAHGRNEAIRICTYDILAISDAGCILDSDWLERITSPLIIDSTVDAVSGGYRLAAVSGFQQCAAVAEIPVFQRPKESFLPSSRSFAVRKAAFWEAGGYPEQLSFAGEDTALCIRLKQIHKKFAHCLDATVTWYPRTSLPAFIKQHYLYGVGDGESGLSHRRYFRSAVKLLFLIAMLALSIAFPVVFGLVFLMLLGYYLRLFPKYEWKNVPVGRSLCAFMLIGIKDLAMLPGYIKGSLFRPEASSSS